MKNPLIVTGLFVLLASGTALAQPDAKSPPPAWQGQSDAEKAAEGVLLTDHMQITSRDEFVKAGEAYFDHQTPPRWVVFQAVPVPKEGKEVDPFYAMYVARLKYEGGKIVGTEPAIKISPDGSANTCGWFHPQKPFTILFGSTMVTPASREKPGFRVGTRNYVWQFPDEMEVVERSVSQIEKDVLTPGELGEQLRGYRALLEQKMPAIDNLLLDGRSRQHVIEIKQFEAEADDKFPLARAIKNWTGAKTVFEKPKYGAECSYSKDGRFILYAQVREELTRGKDDADIWVYDTQNGKHHALITADGYDGGPFFSPDNTRICYRSDRKGDDKLQLFVADLKIEDGVPVGIERETQITANDHVNWAPFWHPSGAYLIYGTSEISHGNYEVFAVQVPARGTPPNQVDPAKLGHRRITNAPGADVLPVFCDDGSWMMWTAQRGPMVAGEGKPSSQVWVARVRTGPGKMGDPAGMFGEKKE